MLQRQLVSPDNCCLNCPSWAPYGPSHWLSVQVQFCSSSGPGEYSRSCDHSLSSQDTFPYSHSCNTVKQNSESHKFINNYLYYKKSAIMTIKTRCFSTLLLFHVSHEAATDEPRFLWDEGGPSAKMLIISMK